MAPQITVKFVLFVWKHVHEHEISDQIGWPERNARRIKGLENVVCIFRFQRCAHEFEALAHNVKQLAKAMPTFFGECAEPLLEISQGVGGPSRRLPVLCYNR